MSNRLVWIQDRREEKDKMSDHLVCPSHERVDASIQRQEEILDQIRIENHSHQLQITRGLAEITEQLKSIHEIRTTLTEHSRLRDEGRTSCERNRADMWTHINAIKTRQDKKDGSMILVASVCTGLGASVAWLLTWLQKNLFQ